MQAREITCHKTPFLSISRQGGVNILECCLFLPRSLESIFPFFADAVNLEAITPPWLHFKILTPVPLKMHAGAIIDYRLRLRGIPIRWQTEIKIWEPPYRFVDEQRRGPYRTWIHDHTFRECTGGCEMRDIVRYAVPGGWLINRLVVQREVRRIFEYRAQTLCRTFA